jgi:hypothetical protein
MATLLSKDIELIKEWDHVAPRFRRRTMRTGVPFKDLAYQMIYTELIMETLDNELGQDPIILKTDLWNEGIEVGRDLASAICLEKVDLQFVGTDVSTYVCRSALTATEELFHIVRSTLLTPPFRQVFDMILDASTVDHMPGRLRHIWIKAEHSLLKENGILLISFDSKLNLFSELYHRLFTRKLYPEWTMTPGEVRDVLMRLGFRILREHALFVPGLFFGTHNPWFPLSHTLARRGIFEFIRRVELSRWSKFLSFLAVQYVIVARKGNVSFDKIGVNEQDKVQVIRD